MKSASSFSIFLGVLQVISASAYSWAPRGKIRLGFLITSNEKADYINQGRTWDELVKSLETETQKKLSNALSPNADFPFDISAVVTEVVEVDSIIADKWLKKTGQMSFVGLLETTKYAKKHLKAEFDVAVLVFGREDGKASKSPYGFTLNGAVCGGQFKYGNAIHIYGQIRKYTKELVWHRLLAHELGHQMGANEGPKDTKDECYDIMSYTPWRIAETQLWKSCSIKRIMEVQQEGGLSCLGL